jgi:hypothetical protein
MNVRPNLRYRVAARYMLVALSICGLQCVEASPPAATASVELATHYERPVLKVLWPVLQTANKAGRIYFNAICPPTENYALAFPRLEMHPPATNASGLAAVRSIFRNKRIVTVVEDTPGIIRIRTGKVPDAILRTRISALSLTPIEQYNPLPAIWAIENAAEVRSAAESLHIVVPIRAINMPVMRPAEGLPHLPGELSNVTMDQALDMVARTWSGIVLYGVCTRPSTYEVSFADGTFVPGSGFGPLSSTN